MSDRLVDLVVTELAPQRLDKYLVNCLPEFSRARLQGLISDGFVLVDGSPARKSGQVISAGTSVQVRIPPAAPSDLVPEAIPLDVLYENADLMVVNKPAGMVVHPASGHLSGTLVHAALNYAPDLDGVGGEHRPGVVHRLDKDTSGLILLAKNDKAHRFLQDQFRKRSVHKTYYALTDGFPPTQTGRVEAPIGRDPSHRKKMAIVPISRGRESVTEYKVIEKFEQHALIAVYPHTGRTHQIRVHFSYIKHPLFNDEVYGGDKILKGTTFSKYQQFIKNCFKILPRQALHAKSLSFDHPVTNKRLTFDSDLPADMVQVIEKWRKYISGRDSDIS